MDEALVYTKLLSYSLKWWYCKPQLAPDLRIKRIFDKYGIFLDVKQICVCVCQRELVHAKYYLATAMNIMFF